MNESILTNLRIQSEEDLKSKKFIINTDNIESDHNLNTLIKDYKRIQKLYPSLIANNIISNIENNTSISLLNLISNYKNIIELLKTCLSKKDNLIINNQYIYFINNEYYPNLLKYNGNNENDQYIYYNLLNNIKFSTWINIYKEMCLKYYSLLCYQESTKNHRDIFTTDVYLKKLKPSLNAQYDEILKNLYLEISTYAGPQKENEDALNKINKEISELQVTINQINLDINTKYSDRADLNFKLSQYKNSKDELLDIRKNFKINNFSDLYAYWNKNIIQKPNLLNFWLEFSNSNEMNNYVVQNIGRRGYSENNDQVTSVYYRQIPNVIYYTDSSIAKNKTGFMYLKVNNIETMFKNSAQGLSAKNIIDDLLYKYLYCAEELNLSIIPIHYLEPNTRILVYDKNACVNNEYIINKISDPISYNGAMTINATKVSERLY